MRPLPWLGKPFSRFVERSLDGEGDEYGSAWAEHGDIMPNGNGVSLRSRSPPAGSYTALCYTALCEFVRWDNASSTSRIGSLSPRRAVSMMRLASNSRVEAAR